MTTAQPTPISWRSPAVVWVVFFTLLLLVGCTLPAVNFFSAPEHYLAFHTVLEFFSMSVSAMVFALAWNLRRQADNNLLILLGSGFLAVALIDIAHTLSYQGMPALITPSGPEKAINFWLAARCTAALVFLAVALVPLRNWPPAVCGLALAVAVGVAGCVWWVGFFHANLLPRTFIDGQGLTDFKIHAEYFLAFLYGLAAFLIYRKSHRTDDRNLVWLAAAAWMQGLAEMFFTLYAHVTDLFNLLGHVYKTVAYLMVYRALFVERVRMPYAQLESERSQLRQERQLSDDIINALPGYFGLLDTNGRMLRWNRYLESFLGRTPDEIATMHAKDFFGEADKPRVVAAMQEVFTQGQSSVDARLLNHTGQSVDVHYGGTRVMLDGQPHLLAIGLDISARKLAEAELQASVSFNTSLIQTMIDGVAVWQGAGASPDVVFSVWNPAMEKLTGYTIGEINRLGWLQPIYLEPVEQEKAAARIERMRQGHNLDHEEWVITRKDGERRTVEITTATLSPAQDRAHVMAVMRDITALKAHEAQLEHIAHYDALTGLPNRRLLADRLGQVMVQAPRRGQLVGIGYLDLDGFKAVNDTHGHEVGDQLLRAVASNMEQVLRVGDTLSRLGGDEFVVVLADLANTAVSIPILNRLLKAVTQPITVGNAVLQVTASLGVSFYPQREDVDADQLLRQADQAMYQAKQTGKNRYQIFDAEHDRRVRDRHESLESIRQALTQGELVVHYQPKVNMRTGQLIGAEALVRWHHPQRGLLLPGTFLPAIEEHALAIDLGEWVMEAVLAQMEAWNVQGLSIPVSVNVGAQHLQHPDFVSRLRMALARHPGVKPGELELEILETSALNDFTLVSQVISTCKALGVDFALDDFGTGYSSLTYLKQLPVPLLKIDQSFVRDLLDDTDDLAILDGVLGMAVAFRRQVIAEGVETLGLGEMLLRMGCEWGQGYAIARPMPAQDFQHWMGTWVAPASWQTIQPVSRDRLPLLYAAVEHRAWFSAVSGYLSGTLDTPPEQDVQRCHIGLWLDQGGRDELVGVDVDHTIDALHGDVHRLVDELIALRRDGRVDEVQARTGVLHRLHDQFLERLQRLAAGGWVP